jgi:hypothetical protein
MSHLSSTPPHTLSDRYAHLMSIIDKKQLLIQNQQLDLKVRIFYENEVEELQKETMKIQTTMVDKGDLEYLPWIKDK